MKVTSIDDVAYTLKALDFLLPLALSNLLPVDRILGAL